ncbi:MAG: hypothetical protein M5U12_13375 [Verrucomicrobia bacterium]|nr:hypothetical protein [Verrucomicrobiota bacterium]
MSDEHAVVPFTQASQVCLVVKRQHRDPARQLAFAAKPQSCERAFHTLRAPPLGPGLRTA